MLFTHNSVTKLTFSDFCPSEPGEFKPFLHRPLTLPCGHTLSADHISIPTPAPIVIDPSLPPHEAAELQQRQQQQRLSLWSSVMCPIPSCKRYSASASSAKYNPSDLTISDTSSVPPVSSGTHGIIHYPPRPTHHVTTETASETGSPLLDVNVEKIIRIVHREATRLDDETAHAVTAFGRVGLNDEEVPDETMLESPLSEVSASSSSLGRAPSKRQKHHLVEPDSAVENYRRSDPDPLDAIKKEMMSVLECDVCAMLLHEPVTTPCQHVRPS